MKERIGRTKPTRAPEAAAKRRKKNDGRPPDTIKDLLLRNHTKKEVKEAKETRDVLNIPSGHPSYSWKQNSCWLDTALELLHATVSHNFEEFSKACESLPDESTLQYLYNMLHARQTLDPTAKDISSQLSKQRDSLRVRLVKEKVTLTRTMSSFEPIFVS